MPNLCGSPVPGTSLDSICSTLAQLAPLRLAEDWDNVGLLIGDRKAEVQRLMTCLTITPDVIDEAIESNADLIVVHHPLPFKPLAKITSDTAAGQMILRLTQNQIAVYSAHTAFDSAAAGINAQWASAVGITTTRPLIESGTLVGNQTEGSGRWGDLEHPQRLGELADRAVQLSGSSAPRYVGDRDRMVKRIAFACGSGGSFLAAAKRRGCNAMITGEATFHTCLEARTQEIDLLLLGHFASERFAMEWLAGKLSDEIDSIEVWCSRRESDPLKPI